jgi:hypothetical protein
MPKKKKSAKKRSGEKPAVFEHLFQYCYDEDGNQSDRFDAATGTIPPDRRLVYSDEVLAAIKATKAVLKHNQAASFSKDFLRYETRNVNWPESLVKAQWTIDQWTGRDDSADRPRNFVWKPYEVGQTDPFPDDCPVPDTFDTHEIQSVTISVASKQIDRMDEARLMQIVVDLRIVETHFALYSPLSRNGYKVVHMDHLQMGLKLHGSEIDGLYLAEFEDNDHIRHPVLITVEAKGLNELINLSQITAQIESASTLLVTSEKIVPIALKRAEGGVFIFEFAPFDIIPGEILKKDSIDRRMLIRTSSVLYKVRPKMAGLSERALRPKGVTKINATQLSLVETIPGDAGDRDDEDNDGLSDE